MSNVIFSYSLYAVDWHIYYWGVFYFCVNKIMKIDFIGGLLICYWYYYIEYLGSSHFRFSACVCVVCMSASLQHVQGMIYFRHSIVASIPAWYTGERGLIPRVGDHFLARVDVLLILTLYRNWTTYVYKIIHVVVTVYLLTCRLVVISRISTGDQFWRMRKLNKCKTWAGIFITTIQCDPIICQLRK